MQRYFKVINDLLVLKRYSHYFFLCLTFLGQNHRQKLHMKKTKKIKTVVISFRFDWNEHKKETRSCTKYTHTV